MSMAPRQPQIATPADMNTPMYMLINLAVGGDFPGWPDATTQFPANFNIDYVHVYSDPSAAPDLSAGGSSDPSTGPTNPTPAASTVSDDYQALSVADGTNIVSATAIYDTVTGGAGADTITATGWGDVVVAGSGLETINHRYWLGRCGRRGFGARNDQPFSRQRLGDPRQRSGHNQPIG
jgi:hypothetical protein